MQRLLTISYPVLPAESAALVDAFRRRHDAKRQAMVQAHFTLAFGCTAVGLDEYSNHVAEVAKKSRPVAFSCKYAMLGADDEEDTAYVFLVPDQGNAAIAQLHDRLYTGLLQPYLRLDLPYVPHITIGSLSSRTEAKSLCNELNRQGISIEGFLNELAVGYVEAGKFNNLSKHALGEA